MRPVRLEIQGLTAFKERQEIDFAGLDLFAITGPTGAGKTTLVDAITYALFGEVPRVGDSIVYERLHLDVTATKGRGVDEAAVTLHESEDAEED